MPRTVPATRPAAAFAIAAALGVLAFGLTSWGHASTSVQPRESLYAVKFVSASEGWTVGAFGEIYHTTDRGQTWQAEASGTVENLFGLDFGAPGIGWAVGRAGTILRRGESGTWSAQDSGTDRHFFQVAALSPEEAWVIGDWGAILHTADGGATWENRSLPEDVILNDICFVDPQHGWIAGEFGAVFATTDGGATWTRLETGIDKSLFGLHFSDLQHGWAVGLDGVLLRTEDGGQTWTLERGKAHSASLERMGFLEALSNPSLYDVDVAGRLGIAVGDMGTILVSHDGGATWKKEDVPAEWSLLWLRSLSLVRGSGTDGLLVGSKGLAIPVDDGVMQYPGR